MARGHTSPNGSAAVAPSSLSRDERTPLLPHKQEQPVGLPMGQLGLICFARIVEPWAFFCVFPFLNQMIHETGVPETSVGLYTGLIESSFCIVQIFIMPLWGRLSDAKGRKAPLVVSMFALAITSTVFGLARNVWTMILFRCLSGIFSGSTVAMRAMISEISTKETQARAFATFGFASTIAMFLGPLAGGLLAKPADNFKLFRKVQLFVEYPYLLPCLFTGLLALAAGTTSLLFLNETLQVESKSDDKNAGIKKIDARSLLNVEGVRIVLAIHFLTFILAFAFNSILPVFQYTPVRYGGFGFSPQEMSYFLAVLGCSQSAFNLLLYPWLHKRIGNRGILNVAPWGWAIGIAAMVGLNVALRYDVPSAVFWTCSVILAVFIGAVTMCYTSATIIINDIVPNSSSLGTINGISLSGVAAIKAVCPVLMTSSYAWGVKSNILWGQFGWLVMLLMTLAFGLCVRRLPRRVWGLPEPSLDMAEVDEEVTNASAFSQFSVHHR